MSGWVRFWDLGLSKRASTSPTALHLGFLSLPPEEPQIPSMTRSFEVRTINTEIAE